MSLRVMICVTHLLGAGHLTRAAALARAFAQAGHDTMLVSGGRPVPLADLAPVRLVQLPAVGTRGTDFRTLLDETGRPVAEEHLAARRALLLGRVAEFGPQVLVTELFPFGRRVLTDEFTALLEAARSLRPRPLILSSIRDILVAPSRPERIAEAHDRLDRFYDAVLVHGDPRLVALDASWPVDERLRPLLRYTGYVDEHPAPIEPGLRQGVVVSGGSSAASLPLYRAAVAAARMAADRPWRILVGRGIAEKEFEALRNAAPPHAAVERARPDFRNLLARAELSVSQAGYNTCVDILRANVPTVLVPFEAGRETEQRLRAERLEALGRARIVPEAALSPESLAVAVNAALDRPAPAMPSLSFDGARQSVAFVEEYFSAMPAIHETFDWSPVDRALNRAADRGSPVAFWWRDDDAVAETPQLDRLLALANRFAASIALAAVPRHVARSLGERLASERHAFALVHGFAHTNHAPAGTKKAEFGSHRPLAAMLEETAEALALATERLGGRLLPVFVPPWNRIAPDLVQNLPQQGYGGLSTFRDRTARLAARGLLQVNTHVDPIDWHGSRSLLDPSEVIATLAAAIERRTDGQADRDEPVGLLTHHLVHDERVWTFCEKLMVYLSGRGTPFATPDRLFSDARIVFES